MTPVDVSIVIVNWNSRDILKQCLVSIEANRGDLAAEVIVIDSGSFDGCGEMLREHFPETRFIQSETNLGFARANNEAARQARGECFLFLNPDTEIVGDAIQQMRRALESRPEAGLVGARLLNANGTVQTSCIQSFPTILNQVLDSEALRRRRPASPLWGMAALFEPGSEPREVEGISGACLMVRRHTFVEVGGFSEDYFMYAEDMDLAYRVKQAGYRNYHVPDAIVVHYGGSSSGQAPSTFTAVMMREARSRFFRKTRGRLYSSMYRLGMLISAITRLTLLSASKRLGRRHASAETSSHKWWAILQWSLYADGVVTQYYPQSKHETDAD